MAYSKIDKILKRQAKAEQEISYWRTHWQEIAEYMLPTSTEFYERGTTDGLETPTGKDSMWDYDTTAVEAAQSLKAYLLGLIFNPQQIWFDVRLPERFREDARVRKYVQDAKTAIHMYLSQPQVNFYTSFEAAFYEMIVFGEGYVLADKHPHSKQLRFRHVPLQNVTSCLNSDGVVDTVFRTIEMTLEEVMERWPEPVEGEYPKEWYSDACDKRAKHHVLHAVYPRDPYAVGSKDKTGPDKNFASCYVLKNQRILLHEGGFDEFPYIVCPWQYFSNETHARGPGSLALRNIRMLNFINKNYLRAIEKRTSPPLFLPHKFTVGPYLDLGAEAINYIDPFALQNFNGRLPIQELGMSTEPQYAERFLSYLQDMIRRMFHGDLIAMDQKKAEMREAEVLVGQEERMRGMLPQLIRLYNSVAVPVLDTVVDFLIEDERLDPPPDKLVDQQYREKSTLRNYMFVFDSAIARAFRALELANWNRTLNQMVIPLANVWPEMLDAYHPRRLSQSIVNQADFPVEILRTEEEFQQMQQEKQQQIQAQQQLEGANMASQALKNVAQAQKFQQGG